MPARKKPKTYKGKSMKPGGGGRFTKVVDALKKKGKAAKAAKAIAASVGRKKYGKTKISKWSAAGRKRAARKRRK